MRYIVVLGLLFGLGSQCVAQDTSPSLKKCLPPLSGDTFKASECSLTYRPPKPLSEQLKVDGCIFRSGNTVSSGGPFTLLQCTTLNTSQDPIRSFQYGVLYLEKDTMKTVAKAGFSTSRRFATPVLKGSLQPGEARILGFIGPPLPEALRAWPKSS